MTVLVTGGAGFIGSAVVDELALRGEQVVVVDNLSRSVRPELPEGVVLETVDAGDRYSVGQLIERWGVESCIHLAGLISVGESVRDPALYFENNVAQSARLLRTLTAVGVHKVVFSSSAAVYGAAKTVPIAESAPMQPGSPYGRTKAVVEQMLNIYDQAGRLRSVSLRYFNAAGATTRRQERHEPETHLIPLAVRAAFDSCEPLTVFGDDYPTPDGTAIRDYIHISDLVDAHLLALDYLRTGGNTTAINLGTGTGNSVLEVVRAVERATRRRVPFHIGPRRPGDPPVLVASPRKATSILGWKPRRSALDEIVASAAITEPSTPSCHRRSGA